MKYLDKEKQTKKFMATQSVRIGWRPYVNLATAT
jgi:hypothetical protein